MTIEIHNRRIITARALRAFAGCLVACGMLSTAALAQPDADIPVADAPAEEAAGEAAAAQAPANPASAPAPAQAAITSAKKRVLDGPPTKLAFRDATVNQMIPFIVEATGKVVMPQRDVLDRKITVLNDQEIPREQALNLVFLALQQNGVGVVETDSIITLRDIGEITRQDVPVVGPRESLLDRADQGTIVEKVYTLRHNNAKNIGDVIKGSLPDFAKLTVDEQSNQVAVLGNIALLQRLERLIGSLDQPAPGAVQAETFRLRFADASVIKTNIEELFSAGAASSGSNSRNRNNQGGGGGFRFPGQQAQQETATATSGELRVSANTQQNSVTVVADPAVLEQIRIQIEQNWDQPLPDEAVIPKVYDLKHSDPVKVRDLLSGLFGSASTGAARTNNQVGNAANQTSASQGAGRLAGQFSFQAIPESGRLVVVAKSPDNLAVIDKIIQDLDQPQTVGLPEVIELKHASAEDLAEQLNSLLALDGTLASIRRAEAGLSAGTATASPFASDQDTDAGAEQDTNASADAISFWWQRSRPPTDRRNASSMIGQLRIVPVWRQNALLVAAPPEYSGAILKLIERLDQPGRQVLISAIIAEISSEDAESLGLRWSSQTITPNNADNSIGIGADASGSRSNFATSLFDTSVLNVSTDVNLLLQALAQDTNVSILSEPKIFTSDNQEAEFFDGQDIPFITDSQTTDQGNITQSFDYRAVGIQLRARPRITVRNDVDLRVNVELSSITPGETLFGGFIVDRRETTTQLIVRNGQTIVISGILRSEDSQTLRKVPLLGDIPLLGYLFQSKDTQTTKTELLIFITPIVVNNPDDSDAVNSPYRERLQQMRQDLGDPGIPQSSTSPATPGSRPAPIDSTAPQADSAIPVDAPGATQAQRS